MNSALAVAHCSFILFSVSVAKMLHVSHDGLQDMKCEEKKVLSLSMKGLFSSQVTFFR